MESPNSLSINRSAPAHWLDDYGNQAFGQWQKAGFQGQRVLYRPLGIVEGFFDSDGTDFEGRADVTSLLKIEVALTDLQTLRQKISLAWAVFRYEHPLACAKALNVGDLQLGRTSTDQRCFAVPRIFNVEGLLQDAEENAKVIFVEDSYPQLDNLDFYVHALNTSRAIDPKKSLAKLFVLRMRPLPNGNHEAQFVMVKAHQICDGLTIFRWLSLFVDLLNLSISQLHELAKHLCSTDLLIRLPPAQEALYPQLHGNGARQRWLWAISRILRHTRCPPLPSFQNPLRRNVPLKGSVSMPLSYPDVLDYSRKPPLNTYPIQVSLSTVATKRLIRLCREAKISVGAGCFTLVAISMMWFYERIYSSVPLSERLPFVGSFPINPRPFLATNTTGKEDSLMLAFSDGITLPFLPAHLRIESRFKLLGRLAHKQLSQYQKKKRTPEEVMELGSRNSTQLIPSLYLSSVERLESKTLPHLKRGINPQGEYPASQPSTLATCGVSSVGDKRNLIRSGKYDVQGNKPKEGEIVCDYRDHQASVRVRDGEFLIGASGDGETMRFDTSCDGCAMDPDMVTAWVKWIESVFLEEEDTKENNSKL